MKSVYSAVLAGVVLLGLSGARAAIAQPVEACEIAGDYIPVGVHYANEPEPGMIFGQEVGSPVNVRSGPGLSFEVTDTTEVGYYVEVVGQAFSQACETWIEVRFPISKQSGWVHSRYIMLTYGRGWWI